MEFEQAKALFDSVETIFGVAASGGALFFLFLYWVSHRQNRHFRHASVQEGTIIDVIAFGRRARPVVAFEHNGKTIQFTSSLAAPGCLVGQRIDLDVTAKGTARIRSSGHSALPLFLLVASVVLAIVASVLLTGRFAP